MTTNSGSHKGKDLPYVPDQYLDLIQDEIQKILACPDFTATEQQRRRDYINNLISNCQKIVRLDIDTCQMKSKIDTNS